MPIGSRHSISAGRQPFKVPSPPPVLGSGLAQVGAQEPTKRLVTGAVIVAAVVIDHFRRRAEKGVHSALGSEEV
jgi:hypothetical protein